MPIDYSDIPQSGYQVWVYRAVEEMHFAVIGDDSGVECTIDLPFTTSSRS